jgi:uncharacterized protein YcbX
LNQSNDDWITITVDRFSGGTGKLSPGPAMTPTIGGLYVYPVKSCKGLYGRTAQLTPRGLLHDREWMIVEASSAPARFVTQREGSRLALIETGLSAAALTLIAPGMEMLWVDYDFEGPGRDVVVWRDTVRAIDQGAIAADWLSAFLGKDVRLVRFDRNVRRLCNREYAGDSGAHTGFADGYPLLVIGSASLDDLNRRLQARGTGALPMNRFRPNLVIDGLDAYDEDHLGTLACGAAILQLVKPCIRCQITATDQESTQVGAEPLRTLAGYRHNPRLGGITFGMNAIVTAGAGTSLAVDSDVHVEWAF